VHEYVDADYDFLFLTFTWYVHKNVCAYFVFIFNIDYDVW